MTVFYTRTKKLLFTGILKPSNILVTEDHGRPVVKIIDFGIAKDLDGSLVNPSHQTRTGLFIGTPDYMSPEQLQGQKK